MRGAVVVVAVAALLLSGCTAAPSEEPPMPRLVPEPVSMKAGQGPGFELTADSRVIATGEGAAAVGEYLAAAFRTATGFALPVEAADATAHDVTLSVDATADPAPESYRLETAATGARLTAATAEGLFRGVQTLRQLFPATIEARVRVADDWTAPAVAISDRPRFAYRGAMLDVARHFFGVADVKRYIDEIALVKINRLHLHLTDDQGWRIQIDSWPKLTEIGSRKAVGLASGGFYTKADYAEIIAYAASRFITVVPEIDLPGHTNAALASYPELTCDGVAPELYTGVEVGFSSLCIDKEVSYRFVADVVRELAEMTPGPYLHLGGDESLSTPEPDFVRFVDRVTTEAVDATGKTVIGWHEMGAADGLPAGTVGQYWDFTTPRGDAAADTQRFVAGGGKVIMSPADVAYLDMVYDDGTRWGQAWANGPTPVSEASTWEPTRIVDGVGEAQLLGVEAPIWTETLTNLTDLEFMAWPRLASVAEIGWSPKPEGRRDWQRIGPRLVAFSERLASLGVNFYRAPDMPWAP